MMFLQEEAKACLEKKVQEFEESSRCQHIEKHKSQVDNSIVSFITYVYIYLTIKKKCPLIFVNCLFNK